MNSEHDNKLILMGSLLALLTGFWILLGASTVEARTNKRLSMPGSNLGPGGNSPVFVGAFLQGGSAFAYDEAWLGYGGSIIFRPGAAADFFPFLYRWNCSAVIQGDYQKLGESMSILSLDGIMRYYLEDMRDPDAAGSAFVGVGLGASKADLPPTMAGTRHRYWSVLVEAGREWTPREEYILWMRAQYRHYDWRGLDYRNWTIQVGAGIPFTF